MNSESIWGAEQKPQKKKTRKYLGWGRVTFYLARVRGQRKGDVNGGSDPQTAAVRNVATTGERGCRGRDYRSKDKSLWGGRNVRVRGGVTFTRGK